MKIFPEATQTRFNDKDAEIVFTLNMSVYPKDVVLKACYVLIDQAYIFLDAPNRKTVDVYLKAKNTTKRKGLEKLRDLFLNELINASVRRMVFKQNRKIIEHVVGGAINAALRPPATVSAYDETLEEDEDIKEIEKEIEALKKELEAEDEEVDEEEIFDIRKPSPDA